MASPMCCQIAALDFVLKTELQVFLVLVKIFNYCLPVQRGIIAVNPSFIIRMSCLTVTVFIDRRSMR